MTKLLIIEDDAALGDALTASLELYSYYVLLAANGPTGLRLAAEWRPDLILLDVKMPGMDGWEVCRRLRETTETPIVMLTAKILDTDVIQGLKSGADDYIKKPFNLDEMVLRIEAVLRRTRRAAPAPAAQYSDDRLQINLQRQVVLRNGNPVHLTPTEFKLLSQLVGSQGQPVSRDALLSAVWGTSYTPDETANLAIYIRYLREKLEEIPSIPKYIRTERGVGYRFEGANGKAARPSWPAESAHANKHM